MIQRTMAELPAWTYDEGPDVGGPVGPVCPDRAAGLTIRSTPELLVEKGLAYRCFCSRSAWSSSEDAASAEGKVAKYDGHCSRPDPGGD